MIVIDLYGLPGCGKSTITYNLYNNLIEQNFKVEMFNKNEYSNIGNRNKNLIIDYLRIFLPRNIKFFFNVIYKIKKRKSQDKKIILNQTVKERVWKNLRLTLLYDKLSRNSDFDVVIVDQGIVQDLSEFIMFKKILNEDIQNYFNYYYKSKNTFIFVNLNLSVEKSIERLKNRNRKEYAFDFLDDKNLKLFLTKQRERIDIIDKNIDDRFIKLNLVSETEKLDKNINLILDNIVKIREKMK